MIMFSGEMTDHGGPPGAWQNLQAVPELESVFNLRLTSELVKGSLHQDARVKRLVQQRDARRPAFPTPFGVISRSSILERPRRKNLQCPHPGPGAPPPVAAQSLLSVVALPRHPRVRRPVHVTAPRWAGVRQSVLPEAALVGRWLAGESTEADIS